MKEVFPRRSFMKTKKSGIQETVLIRQDVNITLSSMSVIHFLTHQHNVFLK